MPDDRATKDSASLFEHTKHLKSLYPGGPTSKYIHSKLRDISNRIGDDFFAVCTESSTQSCHLVDRFDSWNRFLGEINLELSEKELGRIGINMLVEKTVEEFYLHYVFLDVQKDVPKKWGPYFLLHWLLKHHCCIKTLYICESSFEYLPLLHDALHLSCGLEELVLDRGVNGEALERILPAVRTLVKLKVFASGVSPYGLDSLGAALPRVSGLASLQLDCGPMDAYYAQLLLSGMSDCPSLAELTIKDYFLLPREGAALAEFVAESTALRKLCLLDDGHSGMKQLARFFKGLASNRSLEELCLSDFTLEKHLRGLLVEAVSHINILKIQKLKPFYEGIDGDDILSQKLHFYARNDGDALAELVARNTGLRELVCDRCGAECVAAFSRAIRKNTRLQKLQLTLYHMEMQNYKELLTALSCNQSLQELVLDNVLENIVVDLCQLVWETETEGRVKFPVIFKDVLKFTCAIKKCSKLTRLAYKSMFNSLPLPRDAFSELIHYHQLKSLVICERNGPIESECFSDIARFLSWTRTLKDVTLSFPTTAESTNALLHAILQNRSLSELNISEWTFESSDLQLLCDIIRTKKTLTQLNLRLMTWRECNAVDSLAEHLWSNLNLLKVAVQVNHLRDNASFQQRICTATQRNLSTLRCAVQFVMGSSSRRYAAAFEKISDLPSLVEAVQESANKPKEEAKEMVESCKRNLDCNFLAVVGVVKDAVVCEPNGQLQLDCIGLDNWLLIRRYLRVTDIMPEPRGGSGHHRALATTAQFMCAGCDRMV